jgi:hypothetical protein
MSELTLFSMDERPLRSLVESAPELATILDEVEKHIHLPLAAILLALGGSLNRVCVLDLSVTPL